MAMAGRAGSGTTAVPAPAGVAALSTTAATIATTIATRDRSAIVVADPHVGLVGAHDAVVGAGHLDPEPFARFRPVVVDDRDVDPGAQPVGGDDDRAPGPH